MSRRVVMGLMLALGVAGHPVQAAPGDPETLGEFLRLWAADPEAKAVQELLISGIMAGFQVANIHLQTERNSQMLFCEPEKLALSGNQLALMVQAEMQREPRAANASVASVLLVVLEDTFPCTGKK